MQNAGLTWAQDPGAVTELLSGEFFAPLGRSTSHQLWSSAMVISPVLRGVFGLAWDAPAKKLMVSPSLPAEWDEAKLHHLPLGSSDLDLQMKREGPWLLVRASGDVLLGSLTPGASISGGHLRIPLPAVEVGIPHALPQPGAITQQMKVLDQQYSKNELTLRLSAIAGTHQAIDLRVNDPKAKIHLEGADSSQPTDSPLRTLQVDFGPGDGYVEKTVTITW
jgi:hypothetical protein